MYSTPDRHGRHRKALPPLLLLATVVAGLAGGCAQQQQPYTPPPLVVDGAMQRREWDRSVSWYPNGDTVAGPTRFPLRSNVPEGSNVYAAASFDIVASLAQTVALPFTYIFIPPNAVEVYHGEVIGPTYTAMPPMRPPNPGVPVEGLVVHRDTLQVLSAPQKVQDRRFERYGATGMGDTDFELTEPAEAPAREWE
jgi:hypothetical protein